MRHSGEGTRAYTAPIDRYRLNDDVLTPSGERAVVIGTLGGFVQLRYRDALPGADAEVTLHPRLLTKYVPGLKMPAPIRIDCDGRRVHEVPSPRRRLPTWPR